MQPITLPTTATTTATVLPLPPAHPPRTYSTATTAAVLQVQPNTLRVGLCQKGEYLGIRPTKLPNRRLLWPADVVDAVARGQAADGARQAA